MSQARSTDIFSAEGLICFYESINAFIMQFLAVKEQSL
jgi:hypothetical protein